MASEKNPAKISRNKSVVMMARVPNAAEQLIERLAQGAIPLTPGIVKGLNNLAAENVLPALQNVPPALAALANNGDALVKLPDNAWAFTTRINDKDVGVIFNLDAQGHIVDIALMQGTNLPLLLTHSDVLDLLVANPALFAKHFSNGVPPTPPPNRG